MTFKKPSILVLFCIFLLGTTLFGKVYEFRNGRLQIQPGTENSAEVNIQIDDLMKALLNSQERVNDMDDKIRKRDQQIMQLQDDLKAANRELNLLKNHYFRQF